MTEGGTRAPGFDAAEVGVQLVRAGEVAERREVGLWLVGGALRDLLLGRPLRDVDLAVEAGAANALELAARLGALPGWTLEKTHARFGTATLNAPGGLRVDVAATRREEYPAPASLPVVTGTTTMEEDLSRRDFTIHAMARRIGRRGLVGRVLDPFGGRADLDARKIRLLHPKSLVDDPTRAYRAVTYAARLGFAWDREFLAALKKAREANAFHALSGDRMRREIEKMFFEGEWGRAAAHASELSLLGDVLPGWTIPLFVADARPKPEEIWRRLLEPLPRPDRAAIASRLNFSKALRRAAGMEPR